MGSFKMKKNILSLLSLIIVILLMPVLFAQPAEKIPNTVALDDVLASFVDDDGMVDYRGLLQNREKLLDYYTSLASVNGAEYGTWSPKKKLVLWINAYNAHVLSIICDHYPIMGSGVRSFIYPKNSIQQIPGVWDSIPVIIMDTAMSLDEIEHETIRVMFDEPRIHFALVCAAGGCPPLRNEAYTEERLDAQLDDQVTIFLHNPEKFHIDQEEGVVYLSKIFKWYGQDFVPRYVTDGRFSGHSEKERAVLNFIAPYLDEGERRYLATESFTIEYLDYDWSLNEKR
jgi:hypothetical protein